MHLLRLADFRTRTPATAALFFAGVVLGCKADRVAGPEWPRVEASMVVGEAAAALGPDGRFQLPDAPGAVTGREVTREKAIQIAKAFVHDFAPLAIAWWEEYYGARINARELVVCDDRAFYAASNYIIEPSASVSIRREIGGHWLVAFCSGGNRQAVSVSFSAEATEIGVHLDRALQLSDMNAGNFFDIGIPAKFPHIPVPPESAVEFIFKIAGLRVKDVPELVLPPQGYAPQVARWRLVLEKPVLLRGSKTGRELVTPEVYVGFEQFGPLEILLPVFTPENLIHNIPDIDAARRDISVPTLVRPGSSKAFESATVVPQTGRTP